MKADNRATPYTVFLRNAKPGDTFYSDTMSDHAAVVTARRLGRTITTSRGIAVHARQTYSIVRIEVKS